MVTPRNNYENCNFRNPNYKIALVSHTQIKMVDDYKIKLTKVLYNNGT